MAKIQRYDASSDPLDNGIFIKVSELREGYSKIYQELDKELSWKMNSYSRAEILAKKELLEQLLAAIDTEGKKNPSLQEFIATRKTAIIEEQKKLDSNDPLQVSIACSLEGELSAMNAILKFIGTKEGL